MIIGNFTPGMVLKNPNSSVEEIQDYLDKRLPDQTKFTRDHIKVSRLWFDWDENKEVLHKHEFCELTRKITIERTTASKVREYVLAFFRSLFKIEHLTSRYNLSDTQIKDIKTSFEKLFSDSVLPQNKNSSHIKASYLSCKK